MKNIFLAFFLFLFLPSASFAFSKKEAIYQDGSELHEWTLKAGHHISWMECATGGNGSKVAKTIKQEVAKLSWPDFKVLNIGINNSSSNPPSFVGFFCNSGVNKFDMVEAKLKNYVTELKLLVLTEGGQLTETSKTNKTSKLQSLDDSEIIEATGSYPYSGKTALMPKEAKYAGEDNEWLRLCGGKASKAAREVEKKVKELSTPDYKIYQKAKNIERSKNYSHSTGCSDNEDWVIRENNKFVKSLKSKVDKKLGLVKEKTSGYIEVVPEVEANNNFLYCLDVNTLGYFVYKKGSSLKSCYKDQIEINKSQFDFLKANKITAQEIIDSQDDSTDPTLLELKQFANRYCDNVPAVNTNKGIKCSNKLDGPTIIKQTETDTKQVFEDQSENNKELQEAQHYINDLLNYIKINPSTFDIIEITKFMIGNKNILNGSWTDLEKEGFKLFKNYTEASKDFLDFHNKQNDLREEEAANNLVTAENELKKLINYFTYFLQNNLTSVLAPDILANIDLAKDTLSSKEINKLNSIIETLNTFINDKNLISDYREFQNEQIDEVVTKKETKKETKKVEKKINNNLITLKEDFKRAQSALNKLGFYEGVIDGLFGRVSLKALNAWQEKTGLRITTTISFDLLTTLENAANDFDQAITKQEIIEDIEATEPEIFNAEQQAAQHFLNDFLIFIKDNPTSFDIIEITELISVNKGILEGQWNEVQQKDFIQFKNYVSISDEFINFHSKQNDQRQKDILNKIATQNTKLKNIISYLKFYLQNNITSDIATTVIKNIKYAEKSLEDQNLGVLTNANNELEKFINNQNLTDEYKAHVSALSSQDELVVTSTINEVDLLSFDIIKNATDSDFITLVNLSGKAPNAILNLEGKVVFEKDIALSCFYQSKTIKNDLKYYLYDKVANKKFLAFDQGFECNQNNLLNYDLIFFEKDALLREDKSYVSSLVAAIASDHLQLFSMISKKEYEKDFLQREMFAEQISEDVLNETRLGYGSLIIDNDNTSLCTDVNSSLGHISIMNLLANEFTRMGYGKSVNDVVFNNTEDTFINVQRGNCGFIYAGEESLKNLMIAFENSNTKFSVLPIWLSNKQVADEQERQENKEKSVLVDLQKKKEQLEKEKKLKEERLKAEGILKAQEQKALRDRNRVVVEAHVELIENELKILFNKDKFKETWLYESYPDFGKLMDKKFKEKWELDQSSVSINDYGLSDYKGRKIATFITDINFRLMNRDLGEYETMCIRLAIIADSEFSRWREPEAAVCKVDDDKNLTEEELYEKYKNVFDNYKKRLNFQSAWIVE